MTGIRKRHPVFRYGSLKELAAEQDVIVYGRFLSLKREEYRRLSECLGVVAVNVSSETRQVRVPVWQIGMEDSMVLCRKMLTYEEGYNAGNLYSPVENGFAVIELPPISSAVFVAEDDVLKKVIKKA